MKTFTLLCSTLSATLLVSAITANADVVYTFDSTAVGAFGTGPYGTVTLKDTGLNIDIIVNLRSDMNFVNTGGPHSVFSFNVRTAATTDITSIRFNGGAPLANTFTVVAPGKNTPFGTDFSLMIDCTGVSCVNGAPGQSSDPLTFTVLNAEYSDFGFLTSTGSTPASFAADVICVIGNCNGSTGAIGVTKPGDGGGGGGGGGGNAPEPGSLALLGIGLAALGSRLRHSRAA